MKKTTSAFILFISLLSCSWQLCAQTGWQLVPSPNPSTTRNMLRGISGTSASDIWAVGSFQEVFTVPPYYKQNDLIMHWDGSGWFTYPPMNLSFTLDDLWDVEAIAPNDVWTVGVFNGASDPQPEILHFNGSQWTTHNPPAITGGSALLTMDALGANDIWAAGAKTGSPTRPAYVMHYNGTSWTEINVPPVGLYRNEFESIDAVGPASVWAGGFRGETTGDFHAMVMRWNGSNWQNIPLPSSVTSPQGEVIGLKALNDNDVWVVGYYLAGGGFKLHWNGSTWMEMPEPNGGGGAFAAIAPDNVFSVGSEIWHWDGTAWIQDDPIDTVTFPALDNTVTLADGEVWACGISMDASGTNFYSLVYRSGNTLSSGIDDVAGKVRVKIFPNPASSQITVALSNPDMAELAVVNALGVTVKTVIISLESGMATVDVSDCADGIYFLRVRTDAFTDVKKFVISR